MAHKEILHSTTSQSNTQYGTLCFEILVVISYCKILGSINSFSFQAEFLIYY